MSDQILINSKYAYSRVIDKASTQGNKGLRVYRDTPFTIHVQVRTSTDKQGRISGLSVTRQQAIEIAEYLLRKAEELSNDPGKREVAA